MSEENNVVPADVYVGRVVNYGIKETKNGDPEPVIVFQVPVNGKNRSIYWRGSLKEGKAREITIEALLVCGLSTKFLGEMADGPKSNALDTEKDIQLTVINETNDDGKTYAKVQYVNEVGGMLRNILSRQEAVTKISTLKSLAADIADLAKKRNYSLSKEKPKGAAREETPPPPSGEDIPF